MFDIDFYQHMILATWLFIIAFRWYRKLQAFIIVLGVAIAWEAAELLYNLDAYSGFNHFLRDTLYDLIAALIACTISILLLKDKDKQPNL